MINSLVTFLLIFSDYKIGVLSIADWALLLLLCKAILSSPICYIKESTRIPLVIMVGACVGSIVFNVTKSYFSYIEYAESLIKLIVYIAGIIILPSYLSKKNVNVINILKISLVVSVLGGVSQFACVKALGRESWPLYSLAGNYFGLTSEQSMFTNTGMMRARSLWSEPANFAIFISLLFILLLYLEMLNIGYHILYLLGIVLANSMSGYGICILIYFIYFLNLKNIKKCKKMIGMGAVGIIAILVVILSNDYVRFRLVTLMQLKDHSGVVRTVGGFYFLHYIPWYGVGLGNNVLYYNTLTNLSTVWFSGSGEFYNNILVAIITMGYLGTIGFLWYEYEILKNNKKVFWSLLITHFGWGKLYTSPIWVFIIFYITAEMNNKRKLAWEEKQ